VGTSGASISDETEEIRAPHSLRLHRQRIAEADVDGEFLEPSPREVRRDVAAHGGTLEQLVELVGPHDGEPEMVAKINLLRRGEVLGGGSFVVPAAEIHVLRRPEMQPEAEVKRHRALEHPSVGCHDHQSRQQPLERDQLAQPHHWDAALPCRGQE
jgi:hypothetical protein